MDVISRGSAKEIAALVFAVQERRETISISDLFNKDTEGQDIVGGNPNATI